MDHPRDLMHRTLNIQPMEPLGAREERNLTVYMLMEEDGKICPAQSDLRYYVKRKVS